MCYLGGTPEVVKDKWLHCGFSSSDGFSRNFPKLPQGNACYLPTPTRHEGGRDGPDAHRFPMQDLVEDPQQDTTNGPDMSAGMDLSGAHRFPMHDLVEDPQGALRGGVHVEGGE